MTEFNLKPKHILTCLCLLFLAGGFLAGEKAYSSEYLALVNPEKHPKKRAGNDVTFHTIDKGAVSAIKTHERLTIKDKNQWMAIWSKHAREKKTPRVTPHVDFENDMVLAVFQGENSGYNDLVQIDRVRLFKDKMVVLLSHENLGANTTKNTLRSYHIVRVPRSSLPVIFH